MKNFLCETMNYNYIFTCLASDGIPFSKPIIKEIIEDGEVECAWYLQTLIDSHRNSESKFFNSFRRTKEWALINHPEYFL
jgi:hypothetical protein